MELAEPRLKFGRAAYASSVSGPANRLTAKTVERAGAAVRDAAAGVSAEIGSSKGAEGAGSPGHWDQTGPTMEVDEK
jgi:hypothetical protein